MLSSRAYYKFDKCNEYVYIYYNLIIWTRKKGVLFILIHKKIF